MKIKHFPLNLMIFTMRWMTRLIPFIIHPIVRIYANREIIACGLRAENGDVRIVYTPYFDRGKHTFYRKAGSNWISTQDAQAVDFSDPLIKQVTLPYVNLGDVCRVHAIKDNTTKILKSPKILIKERTVDHSDSILIEPHENGEATISYAPLEMYHPMLYFIAVEQNGRCVAAIYTREKVWTYPRSKDATLSITNQPPYLEEGKKYTVRIAVVDYDGWVPVTGKQEFIYTKNVAGNNNMEESHVVENTQRESEWSK